MGKKGSSTTSSWLTAVKRAFRSPTKETTDQKRNTRRKEDHPNQVNNNNNNNNEDDEKKREKRRWLFRKPTIHETTAIPQQQQIQQKDDVPSMEVLPNNLNQASANHAREISAAILIQTGFRGYLARRALRALKGLVKLQALVRGHNVRKQAKMTLKCMQALVRVQSRVLDQRMRLSHDGTSRKSAFSDTTSLCGSRYLQDGTDRKSVVTSRDGGSSVANDDWDDRPHTIEEVKAMLQSRKDAAALRRERNLSQAFSQQIWRSGRNSSIGGEDEIEEEKPKWLDRWMATKPWEKPRSRGRTSTDQRDSIKTVEIDTAQPYSHLSSSSSLRKPINQRPGSPHKNQRPNSPRQNQRPESPHHRSKQASVTPSPSKTRPAQIWSASPRCGREDRPQTPSLRSYNYQYNSGVLNQNIRFATSSGTNYNSGGGALPNYMQATESAKARIRSQSAPRQRMATPERERNGSVKKRLSYPLPPDGSVNHHQHMRSPSFKSVQSRAHTGFTEQQSIYSSCYTESIGGEISPSSTTTDLRRWMR